MLLSALSVSSHSLFGDSVHRMRSVLSGYQGGAAIFRSVSPPRRGWTKFAWRSRLLRDPKRWTTTSRVALHFTIYAVAGYLLYLWPHGLASFSSKLPGLRSAWRCAVARRSLRSPTNCVVALQASSLRPPPPASLRSCLRGRLSSLRGALDLSRSQKDLGCSESSLPEAYAKHLITFFGDALLTRISVSRLISWPYAKFREPRIGELRQGELRRIPKRRSSRWRESLYSLTLIGRCTPEGGCYSVRYYVSSVQTWQARGPSVHKTSPAASGRGRAKGRSQGAWELRPYERSRCVEHVASYPIVP